MSQEDAFERIVNGLNEAMLDDARWPGTSARIDEAFGSRGSMMVLGEDRPKGNVEVFFAKAYNRGADRSDWRREYFRDYYPEDESLPRVRALPDSKIVPIATLFNEQEQKTSRMFNEALVRYRGQKGLIMRLDGPGRSRIVWGIADPVDGDGWSSSQLDMIARVLPHVRQYVRVHTALVDAGALGRSVTGLLDNTSTGVIQLDLRARIVEANDRAGELLLRVDGLSAADGELRASSPVDNDRLQRLLAQALPRFGEQAASGSMLVRRPSLLPSFALHVKPVTNRELEYRSRHVAALVLIVDPVDRARVDPGLVERVLGLTPAETEIAVLLAEGRTARQIAAATGRGYSTVRTHLKHMFVKLGVSRQVEVVQLVLALASLPVSRD